MSEQSKPKTQPASQPASEGEDTKTLSAPATVRVHDRLRSAQKSLKVDKATVIRLSVRLFIAEFYKGGDKWDFPPTIGRDVLPATNSEYMDLDLPS